MRGAGDGRLSNNCWSRVQRNGTCSPETGGALAPEINLPAGCARLSGNLVQQSPRVCFHPALHGLAGLDAEDLDPSRRHGPAGGGAAHELTQVGTAIDTADRNPFPGSEDILEGDREIRERPAVVEHGPAVIIRAKYHHVERVVAGELGGQKIPGRNDVALVPNLLEESAYYRLQIGHGRSPSRLDSHRTVGGSFGPVLLSSKFHDGQPPSRQVLRGSRPWGRIRHRSGGLFAADVGDQPGRA